MAVTKKQTTAATSVKAKGRGKPAETKPTAKKVTANKKTKTVAAPKVAKLGIPTKAYTQTELTSVLSEQLGITRKDVKNIIDILPIIAKHHLAKKGPGQFTIPGIVKIVGTNKAATKARKGRNPATGEEITIKAKPARRVVKARIMKKFKVEVE